MEVFDHLRNLHQKSTLGVYTGSLHWYSTPELQIGNGEKRPTLDDDTGLDAEKTSQTIQKVTVVGASAQDKCEKASQTIQQVTVVGASAQDK